jgi:CHAT domain-containing protein
VQSVKWEIFKKIKRMNVYLPSGRESIFTTVERELGRLHTRQFAKRVAALSRRHPTSVLMFDARENGNCVWLFKSDGTLIAAQAPIWRPEWLRTILQNLGVSTNGLTRSRYRRTAASRACTEPDTNNSDRGAAGVNVGVSSGQSDVALRRLSALLLPARISDALQQSDDRRLIIVPTKGRGLAPFAALPLGDQHLIDKYSILVTSSIAGASGIPDLKLDDRDISGFVLALRHRMYQTGRPRYPRPRMPGSRVGGIGQPRSAPPRPVLPRIPQAPIQSADARSRAVDIPLPVRNPSRRAQGMLFVGNPDLSGDRNYCWADIPNAQSEAELAARLFNSKNLFVRKAARYRKIHAVLKAGQSNLKYIYFATHGLSDTDNPADGSFLALTGRHLTAAGLRRMKFQRAPLVVMSACQTGLGKVFPGGIFGMAQAWHYAGAGKVITTLWNVNDTATADLMRRFNRILAVRRSGDIAVDEAEFVLTEAIREFKKTTTNPADWAGVVTYGTPVP